MLATCELTRGASRLKTFTAKKWRKAVNELTSPQLLSISDAAIAALIGVSRPVVSYQLKGTREPSQEHISAIDQALGELTNSQEIQRYLDATYFLDAVENGLEDSLWPSPSTDLYDGYLLSLLDINDYLKDGWNYQAQESLDQIYGMVLDYNPVIDSLSKPKLRESRLDLWHKLVLG
jgi:DNA-binding transcriptional regulator YdaS (Cro superfamily)